MHWPLINLRLLKRDIRFNYKIAYSIVVPEKKSVDI